MVFDEDEKKPYEHEKVNIAIPFSDHRKTIDLRKERWQAMKNGSTLTKKHAENMEIQYMVCFLKIK